MGKSVVLSPKREQFCQRFVVHGNAAKAAEEAGYSLRAAKQMGHDLQQVAAVSDRIQVLMAERGKRNEIDADFVLKRLQENLERAMQAEPVRDSHGKPTGEYRYDGAVANRALELLGKHLGMFTDRVDHTTNGQSLPPSAIVVTLVKATP
jgi:phage terminase small subunit